MSPVTQVSKDALAGFPRVSGDEPGLPNEATRTLLFSPRERG